MARPFKERYIKPEVISVGDVVRWTRKKVDITVSVIGTVAQIKNLHGERVFYTAGGMAIGSYTIAWNRSRSSDTITLLKPAPHNTDQPLEKFAELLDIAEQND